MAPRTLSSTWKQFEKLGKRYEGSPTRKKADVEALDDLSRRINSSKIVDAIATLFVQKHQGMEGARIEFVTSSRGKYPDWATSYSSEENVIHINPIGIFRFYRECQESVRSLKTSVARENFRTYRYQAYLAELRKLPTEHLLFLQVLKEVAKARQITQAEKRGGGLEESEDDSYMVLLWAFKELENLFAETTGLSLRSEYTISWYESDWFLGQ